MLSSEEVAAYASEQLALVAAANGTDGPDVMVAVRDGHFAAGPFPALPIPIKPTRKGVRLALQKAVEVRNKTVKDRPPLQLPQHLAASRTSHSHAAPPSGPGAAASASAAACDDIHEADGMVRSDERGPGRIRGDGSSHRQRGGDPCSPADQVRGDGTIY